MPSRVIGSTSPAASPTRHQFGPAEFQCLQMANLQRRDGPGVGLEARAGRDRRSGNPRRRAGAQRGGANARVRLCADADSQMVRAGKRPDVARRIRHELDDDLVAGDTVRKVAGGDRQRFAWKRPSHSSSDQAVGSVGANRKPREAGAIARVHPNPGVLGRHVQDALSDKRRANPLCGSDQRAIEIRTAGYHQRGRRVDAARVQRYGDGASHRGIDETCTVDWRGGERCGTDCLGHERERPAGHAATARLLARMRAVEHHNASALARQRIGGPRAGRSGPDHRNVSERGNHKIMNWING